MWIDGWQLQCCGEPLVVGSRASLMLRPADRDWLTAVLGDELARSVGAVDERHPPAGVGVSNMIATVESITAVHCRLATRVTGGMPVGEAVPGTTTCTSIESADGWTAHQGELSFMGYLVRMIGVRSGVTPRRR